MSFNYLKENDDFIIFYDVILITHHIKFIFSSAMTTKNSKISKVEPLSYTRSLNAPGEKGHDVSLTGE